MPKVFSLGIFCDYDQDCFKLWLGIHQSNILDGLITLKLTTWCLNIPDKLLLEDLEMGLWPTLLNWHTTSFLRIILRIQKMWTTNAIFRLFVIEPALSENPIRSYEMISSPCTQSLSHEWHLSTFSHHHSSYFGRHKDHKVGSTPQGSKLCFLARTRSHINPYLDV